MSISIKIIRDSFGTIQDKSAEFSERFYAKLFEKYPESKTLFHNENIEKQKQLLFYSIEFIVSNLENEDRLAEFLQNLGQRHISYGVDDVHFTWAEDILNSTLKSILAEQWTEEVRKNWSELFETIQDYMMQGMRRGRLVNLNKEELITPSSSLNTKKDSNAKTKAVTFDIRNYIENEARIPESLREQIRHLIKENLNDMIRSEIQSILEEELDNISDKNINEILSSFKAA